MPASTQELEKLRDMLKILLDQNQPENVRNEIRNQLLQGINQPDSPLGKAWEQVAGKSAQFASNPQEFKEMLSSSLPMQNRPIPKPENYNSVLEAQFKAVRPELSPLPPPTKQSGFAARVEKDMMLVMKRNPEAAAEFLSKKAINPETLKRARALFVNLKEALKNDKTAMSAMLIGLKGNPMGFTLLGGTGQSLSRHLESLPGEVTHKLGSHSVDKTEKKLDEKPSLQRTLKGILKTVVSTIETEKEHVDTHKPATPFSMDPKPGKTK